jgi:hypothetical protein
MTNDEITSAIQDTIAAGGAAPDCEMKAEIEAAYWSPSAEGRDPEDLYWFMLGEVRTPGAVTTNGYGVETR